MSTGDLISRVYGSFRGADFRGNEVNLVRSPDCLNVYKDYLETESIKTRPEMEMVEEFNHMITGIYFYEADGIERMLVHCGETLYEIVNGERKILYTGVYPRKSTAFVFNKLWYFMDGYHYLQYDGTIISEVVGYIPTTSISRKPAGGGRIYEDVNLLTGIRINTFLADGESNEFVLDAQNIDEDYGVIVKVNDEIIEYTRYTVDYESGHIVFNRENIPAPSTDGKDNVSIQFRKNIAGYRERIENCTLVQVFDNRVFFSGNPNYPNVMWHCSLNDPSYCSDLDYYNEGTDLSKITGIVAGNNALWVFKEPSQAKTSVFYHTPTIDNEYGKIYPSVHSSISTGCIGKAVNFNDDICFFSERGMEGIAGDVTTEQMLAHRSTLADRKLLAERSYRYALVEEWNGYLLVIIGNKVFLADSRATFTNENHLEYEWFYWELSKSISASCVKDGILYLGTDDGIYTLTDMTSPVYSYWTTPVDKFNHPQYQKSTNKRGCVIEAEGDIDVYAKTDTTDFELISSHRNITDSFVCRIKRKKFKDIQLKFYSATRFRLEMATLECYIGSYIK